MQKISAIRVLTVLNIFIKFWINQVSPFYEKLQYNILRYVQFQNKLLSLFGLIDRKVYQCHDHSPVNCNRRFWKAKKVYDICYVGQYSLLCIQNFFHLQSQLSIVGFCKGAFTHDVLGVHIFDLPTLIRYFTT